MHALRFPFRVLSPLVLSASCSFPKAQSSKNTDVNSRIEASSEKNAASDGATAHAKKATASASLSGAGTSCSPLRYDFSAFKFYDRTTQSGVLYGPVYNFTQVAVSADGLTWNQFSTLKHGASGYFPGNLPYNHSNGMVRASYDVLRNKILLVSEATPEPPELPATHADAGKMFLYEVDPAKPDQVMATRVFEMPHAAANDQNRHAMVRAPCAPGLVCATTKAVP